MVEREQVDLTKNFLVSLMEEQLEEGLLKMYWQEQELITIFQLNLKSSLVISST